MLIFALLFIAFLFICVVYSCVKGEEIHKATIERRRRYVEQYCPNARIIVNNGVHLFFKDDEKQVFGIDESEKLYGFAGLLSISRYKDGISFQHKDSITLCVGKDYCHQNTTFSLDSNSINLIYAEMMPVLKNNLQKELDKYGVTSTHEYELDGEIWGCDINTKHFYCVYGCPGVYNFSDLQRVTVEDMRNNTLYDGSYIIHVFIKNDDFGEEDYEINIKNPDATYYNLLAMFKGIRNQQRR